MPTCTSREDLVVLFGAPELAAGPAEVRAQQCEHRWDRLIDRTRIRQQLGDQMLEMQSTFGALAVADILQADQ